MFKNITIKSRLIFVISFLALQLIVGAVIGITSLGFANDAMHEMYDSRLVAVEKLDKIIRMLNVNQLNVAKSISASDQNALSMMDEVDGNIQKITQLWKEYTAHELGPEEKKLADQFAESRKKFVEEALKPAVTAIRTQNTKGASDLLQGPMNELFQPTRKAVNELMQLELSLAKKQYEDSQTTYQLVRAACIAGMTLGLVLAAILGMFLVRAIVRPLDKAVKVAAAVAGGDLTQRIEVTSKDETGRLMKALRDMNDGLVKIVSQVRSGTDTIATASNQISAGNMDLSSRTEQQASSLEETAASMEELTSTVKQNADNAHQANQLAMSASEIAMKGGRVVGEVVTTMGAINESAKKIVDIIGVIDGIAFQTNILALNAAVEAARAGEQGRGFAVVASEVRSLAQRSASAAKEIKALIDDSVEKVGSGTRLVDEAGMTMEEVVGSVKRVNDIISEIAAASDEQRTGIEQVNQAISQMDQVTQQNAALVEEAAAAASSMQDQAGKLLDVVSVFRVDATALSQSRPSAVQSPARVVQRAPAQPRSEVRTPAVATPAKHQIAGVGSSRPVASNASDDWEEF